MGRRKMNVVAAAASSILFRHHPHNNRQQQEEDAYHYPTAASEVLSQKGPPTPHTVSTLDQVEDDSESSLEGFLSPTRIPKGVLLTSGRRCLSLSDLPPPSAFLEDSSSSLNNASGSNGGSSSSRRRRVSFSDVEVRSYAVVIGDHPCCPSGCSVQLGWDYDTTGQVKLEDYEAQRRPQRRRSTSELRMTAQERQDLLLQDAQHSSVEVRRASRRLHRARSGQARGRINQTFFHQHEKEDEEDDQES